MITLVWRTDVHMADESPQSRTDDWTSTVLDKLGQVGAIARQQKAAAVLDGGDFFHIKSPGRNSHEVIRKVADLHKTYSCEVFANVGNHDCVYGDISFLDQQPLGVLFATGVFRRCYGQHEAVFTQDGMKVRVVGIPYHGVRYDKGRFDIKKGDEDYLVVMAHVLASRQGGTMFEGEDIISYDFLKDLDPDLWLFGHWHKNQGVDEIAPGKWVVNTGSLTRGALNQDNLDRVPSCAVLRFTPKGMEIEEFPLAVATASEIFDLEAKDKTEARSFVMEAFVDSLKSTLKQVKGRTLLDIIRESDVPDKIKERALLYVE